MKRGERENERERQRKEEKRKEKWRDNQWKSGREMRGEGEGGGEEMKERKEC